MLPLHSIQRHKQKYMKLDAAEIINSIREVYERDTFTVGELVDILIASGYKPFQARRIIHQGLRNDQMGRVTYKNLGRNIPRSNSYVLLRPKPKPKPPVI